MRQDGDHSITTPYAESTGFVSHPDGPPSVDSSSSATVTSGKDDDGFVDDDSMTTPDAESTGFVSRPDGPSSVDSSSSATVTSVQDDGDSIKTPDAESTGSVSRPDGRFEDTAGVAAGGGSDAGEDGAGAQGESDTDGGSARPDSPRENSTFQVGEKDLAAEEISKVDADVEALLRRPGVDANFLLYEASKRNSVRRMEELVRRHGADVNAAVEQRRGRAKSVHRAPPLFAAVEAAAITAVKWLLAQGADPDCQCFDDGAVITPLWAAAENGNCRVGKLLLDHRANVNAAKSTTGNTPLFIAVQNHQTSMISLLLSFGADPNQRDVTSPLECAIGSGYPEVVAQLLNGGADVDLDALAVVGRVLGTKESIFLTRSNNLRRRISDKELEQIQDSLTLMMFLQKNPKYTDARAAEKAGDHRRALTILRSLNDEVEGHTQIKLDMERNIKAIYGVKGSDCTISIWDNVPLMTQTEPPHLTGYAWTQVGRKIYRHGGIGDDQLVAHREDLSFWELDIDARIWKVLKATGKSPGPRIGHTMWAWKDALFVWGGESGLASRGHDAKLYRLPLKKGGPLSWEIVKTPMKPRGRKEHAGVLYKGKYYITCGYSDLNDTWVLNMNNFKWKALPNGPVDRYCHGMWAVHDKLYILGGRRFNPGVDVTSTPHLATYSIERFVSFDLRSNRWRDENIVGDRPYDLSEFTVLPLFEERDKDDDPTSVIVWGGYHEFDRLNGPCADEISKEGMEELYGDQGGDFQTQYLCRMLRFYPDTMTWKKLESMSEISPKAQSFAAEIRKDNRYLKLLVGGGYGFTGESVSKTESFRGRSVYRPESSNAVYSVMTGNIGDGSAFFDTVNEESWAWEFFRLSGNEMPRLDINVNPWSPNLHFISDYTHEDFAEPPTREVKPNDEGNLLGLRVKLCGLVKRTDLNGRIGRAGCWSIQSGRYEVCIPNPTGGRPTVIAVKPENIEISDRIELTREGVQELFAHASLAKKFPTIAMTSLFDYHPNLHGRRRPLFEQLANPQDLEGLDGKPMTIFDLYHGPVNRRAQAIMRTISDANNSGQLNCNLTCMLSRASSSFSDKVLDSGNDGIKLMKHHKLYSDFVIAQRETDATRVHKFEERIAAVGDSEVATKCGEWLRLQVRVDGLTPAISRDILVNPNVTMQGLHHHILCPVLGWKSYSHHYAFRRCRKIEDYCYTMQALDSEVWVGPKKGSPNDSMFQPLYIGTCMANDRKIDLGQLFALDGKTKSNELLLQWVYDFGDWWSHTIRVSKYDGAVPAGVTVAHLIAGEGGSIPEDTGGIPQYYKLMLKLTGKGYVNHERNKGLQTRIDPSSELWWEIFNDEFRRKANGIQFISNPVKFKLSQARADLHTELRRPKPKDGTVLSGNHTRHLSTGLIYTTNEQSTVAMPRKLTDVCAYCGVTVALKKCSACYAVSYCCREHAVANWPNHKLDCRIARKKTKTKTKKKKDNKK